MHAASFDLAEFKQHRMKSWRNYKVRNLKCTEQREAGSNVARTLCISASQGHQPGRLAATQSCRLDSTPPDSSLVRAARRRRRMQRERVKTNCIKDKGRQTAAKDQNDACLRSRAFHNVLCFTHLCIYVSVCVCVPETKEKDENGKPKSRKI